MLNEAKVPYEGWLRSTLKCLTRQERIARDKHASLCSPNISDKKKKYVVLATGVSAIELLQ